MPCDALGLYWGFASAKPCQTGRTSVRVRIASSEGGAHARRRLQSLEVCLDRGEHLVVRGQYLRETLPRLYEVRSCLGAASVLRIPLGPMVEQVANGFRIVLLLPELFREKHIDIARPIHGGVPCHHILRETRISRVEFE